MSDRLRAAIRTVPDFPKPGIQFKDITPVLAHPDLLREAVDALVAPFLNLGITKVVGIESRGFILGAMMAERIGAGFVPVRKPGKLPAATIREQYALEYGADTIEMHEDALDAEELVLVHDDVIATGGTAAAACRLVERRGARLAGCAFLIELTFLNGRQHLPPALPLHVVVTV
jgi:adenine phosphoribosyltransferase